MKNFWPYRSEAKGFSIEKLAHKYRERISSFASDGIPHKYEMDKNFKKSAQDDKEINRSFLLVQKGHWANRDFSEYRNAA